MNRQDFLRAMSALTVFSQLPAAIAAESKNIESNKPAVPPMFTADNVEADFTELLAAFNDIHPNPFWSRSRKALELDISKIVSNVRVKKHISEPALFQLVARFVISIDDPHCWTFTPGWAQYLNQGGKFLPLEIRFDGQTARVSEPAPDGLAVGARVAAINGESMSSLIKAFRPLTGQMDDPFGDDFLSTFFARYLWYFKGWGSAERATFDIQTVVGGKSKTTALVAMSRPEKEAVEKSATKSNALDLRIISPGIGLLEFRRCIDPEQLRALAEPIFRTIQGEKITRLVVDARTNAGGGDAAWITLLEFLTDKSFSGYRRTFYRVSQRLKDMQGQEEFTRGFTEEAWAAKNGSEFEFLRTPDDLITPPPNPLRFSGKWCVLAGRGTFSSGMSFICAVKAFKLATVIGQETGGRVRGFGQWVRVRLPNSKIEVAMSTKQFDGAVDVPYRRGVPPDIAVKASVDAALNSPEDATFQAAIRHLS